MAKIHYLSPADMVPHPMLARVGMMRGLAEDFAAKARKSGKNREENKEKAAELQGDWLAFLDSVREDGIIEPLKVCRVPEDDAWHGTKTWYVVDGRNRWTAAGELELRSVPVIKVSAEDAPDIIAATVAGRRHYTKAATAYLAILLHPDFATEGEARKKQGLKVGVAAPSRTECGTATSALSAEVLAEKFSVSPRLLEQAAELFRLVNANPRFGPEAEADVWAGCGLGGILAGMKSLIATGGRAEMQSAEYKAAAAAWGAVTKFESACKATWERWDVLDAERREAAVETVKAALAAAPEPLRAILKTAL